MKRTLAAPRRVRLLLAPTAGLLVLLAIVGCERFRSADEHVASAESALAADDYDAAARELSAALDKSPENARARVLAARVALARGNATAARAEVDHATRAGAAPADLRPLLPRLLLAEGKADEALAMQAAIGQPDELLAGDARLAKGEPALALEAYARQLAAKPGDLAAVVGRARALVATGRTADAIAGLQAAIGRLGDRPQLQRVLGQLLLAESRLPEGEEALSSAAAQVGALPNFADKAELWFTLSDVRLAIGDVAGASTAADRLAMFGDNTPALLWMRARIAEAQGDRRSALEFAQRLAQATPNEPNALVLLGSLRGAAGEMDTAVMYLERAVQLAPESTEARKALARALVRQDRSEAAAEVLLPLAGTGQFDEEVIGMLLRVDDGAGGGVARLHAMPASPSRDLALATAALMAGDAAAAVRLLDSRVQWGGFESRRQRLRLLALSAGADKADLEKALVQWVARDDANANDIALAMSLAVNSGQNALARRLGLDGRRRFPADNALRVRLAHAELAAGNLTAAEQLASGGPPDPHAALVSAQVQVLRGDRATATKRLEAALAAFPGNLEVRAALARLLAAGGDTATANRLLDEGLKRSPKAVPLLLAQGDVRLRSSPAGAVESFGKASAATGNNPVIRMRLADAALRAGDKAVAQRELQAVLEQHPAYLPALQGMVRLDIEAQRFAAARGRIQRAAGPTLSPTRRRLLDAQVVAGEGRKAAAGEDLLAEARRTGDTALFLAAADYLGSGAPARRLALLDEWLQGHPRDTRVLAQRAELRMAARDTAGAVRDLEAAIAVTESPVLVNNLAWLYASTGDQRALATAQRAVVLAPWLPQARDTYGSVLLAAGRVPEAVTEFRRAHDAEPTDRSIALNLAEALGRAGDRAAARTLAESVLAKAGQSPERARAEAVLKQLN